MHVCPYGNIKKHAQRRIQSNINPTEKCTAINVFSDKDRCVNGLCHSLSFKLFPTKKHNNYKVLLSGDFLCKIVNFNQRCSEATFGVSSFIQIIPVI